MVFPNILEAWATIVPTFEQLCFVNDSGDSYEFPDLNRMNKDVGMEFQQQNDIVACIKTKKNVDYNNKQDQLQYLETY